MFAMFVIFSLAGPAAAVTRLDNWQTGLAAYTAPPGANRLLVFVTGFENNGDTNIINVTFGGQPLTEGIGSVTTAPGFKARCEIWYLLEVDIPPGSNDFAVTYQSGQPGLPMHAATTYANVDQAAPIFDQSVNQSSAGFDPGINPITTPIDVVAGGMAVAGVVCGNAGSFTWGNGWTEGSDQVPPGTTTMSTADHPALGNATDIASALHSSTINRQVIVVLGLRPFFEPCDATFAYVREIVINAAQTGASCSADLTDFPVLLRLAGDYLKTVTSDPVNGRIESPFGYDIVFILNDGNLLLDHEIQRYDSVAGELDVWVRVPDLAVASDTTIRMLYGNPCVAFSPENAAGVWEPGYEAVLHLQEAGIGSDDEYRDSSGNNHSGTGGGLAGSGDPAQTPDRVGNGKFGFAQDFDDADQDHIRLDAVDDFDWTAVTVQAWINVDDGGDDRLFGKSWGTATNDNVWQLGKDADIKVRHRTNSSAQTFNGGNNFTPGDWTHFVYTWDAADGGAVRIYQNGVLAIETSMPGTDLFNDPRPPILGNALTLNRGFDGQMQEARLSMVARSSCWIETEYNNQDSPDTFVAVGPETLNDCDGQFDQRLLLTADADQVCGTAGTLTDYPILVSIANNPDLRTLANGGKVYSALGYDIIFRAADGQTQLKHEIETYDGVTGTLVAWVNIPTLAKGTDTPFFMYYGNCGIVLPSGDPQAVWNQDFVGVWHLHDDFEDSTGFENNGTNFGSFNAPGIIADAQEFDGIDDAIVVPHDDSLELSDVGQVTVATWVRKNTAQAGWIAMVQKSDRSYNLQFDNGNEPAFTIHDGTWNVASSGLTLNNDQWYHLVGTYDGTDVKIYVDGIESGPGNTAGGISLADTFDLGIGENTDASGRTIDGRLDEVRISATARSADWICTSYNNQSDPGSFITVGPQQPNPPTLIELIDFQASAYRDGVVLTWQTGYEVDNLGFHIYREQAGRLQRLNSKIIAGAALLTGYRTPLVAGRSYRWWTPGTAPAAVYWLEDVDLNGKHTRYGPISPRPVRAWTPNKIRSQFLNKTVQGLHRTSQMQARIARVRHKMQTARPYRNRRLAERLKRLEGQLSDTRGENATADPLAPTEKQFRVQRKLAANPAIKIWVARSGWYRIGQTDLVQAGLPADADPKRLALYTSGRRIPLHIAGAGDGRFDPQDSIAFWGDGLDRPATDARVYWLKVAKRPGKRVVEVSGKGYGRRGDQNFISTARRKDRLIYIAALKNGEAENFIGPGVSMLPLDQVLRVPHPDQQARYDALLEVVLQGVTDLPHSVQVRFNDQVLGDISFAGMNPGEGSFFIPQDQLFDGDNLVTLVATAGEMDWSTVDHLRLSYWHTYTADDDQLTFSARGRRRVTIDGFRSGDIKVVDITNPLKVKMIHGRIRASADGYAVTLKVPGRGQRRLFAFTDDRILAPHRLAANRPSGWHDDRIGAEVVMIAHAEFLDPLWPLVDLREDQGWSVALIDLEDIYDEYSFGIKDPEAIRDFLMATQTGWSDRTQHVLLVGDASFDPRNYLGAGHFDFVPTRLVDTAAMETASDDWFVDFDRDGLADINIGRLPVRSAGQTETIVDKLLTYADNTATTCGQTALLFADANDGFDFENTTRTLQTLVPDEQDVDLIMRSEVADAKALLWQSIADGPALVNYFGHGSVELWRGNLLSTPETTALAKSDCLPVFINMTCLNGFFHDLFTTSLAEALLSTPDGGAIGVWASSGSTGPQDQALLNRQLFRLLFSDTPMTLGEAFRRAKQRIDNPDVRRTWLFFGDPLTRLRTAANLDQP